MDEEFVPEGKQLQFCYEFIIDSNGAAAARRAGYSDKGANVKASQLLTKNNIQKEIARLIKERSERTKIDADWLLVHCSQMLKADIGDIINELGHFKPIHEWPKIWRQMLNGADIKEIFEWTDGKKEKIGDLVKAKFVAREKIMEITGKHVNVAAFIGQDNGPKNNEEPEPLDSKFF